MALLKWEVDSLEGLAQRHPLTSILQGVLRENPPPAVITLVSHWNHDVEPLVVALPRLRGLGYQIIDLCHEKG